MNVIKKIQVECVVITAGIETSHPEYLVGISTAMNGGAEYYRMVHENCGAEYYHMVHENCGAEYYRMVHEKRNVKDMWIPCNV